MKVPICLLFIYGAVLVSASGVDLPSLNIWPMPKYVTNGNKTLYMASDFVLDNTGSKFGDASGILRDGFSRMLDVVKLDHAVDGNFSRFDPSAILKGINVVIDSPSDELQYGVNESYTLTVSNSYAHIEAKTVYGALHGLQTFSQLCHFNLNDEVIEVDLAPWTIIDQPRFLYRGLLIDTSRHYLPLPVIKNVIDSMSYAKLNVLHWHIVDTQSFPLEIPSYPKLWDGAYSTAERYTVADAKEIVSYAQSRGINVLAELDVPGHAASWGFGYPALWPSANCMQPLDVSNEFTFKLIDGILSDFSKIFKFKFVHLGGDEVNTSCWETTPHVEQWLKQHKLDGSMAYQYFVLRAQKLALSHGYEIVNWEETFINFAAKLSPSTVVHNWLVSGIAAEAVASGFRAIVSNQDKWYLDHLDATWDGFYMNEPLAGIKDPRQQALILGGEVCMWGEHIDGSDIQQTIWPRAAAAAERLWTPYSKLAKNPREVTNRLAHFRCLLNQRGIAAAPLAGLGRATPDDPGSCYKQ
ncbi:Beta-hexosaminidase 3 [Dionaea muscipula]